MAVVAGLLGVGFVLAAALRSAEGPTVQRRSHFRLRMTLLAVLPAVPVSLLFGASAVHLISPASRRMAEDWLPFLGFALILSPALLYRPLDGPPRPPDDDEGWGHGPGEPPPAPRPPKGGIPLADASQPQWRVRDHGGPGTRRISTRRAGRPVKPLTPARR